MSTYKALVRLDFTPTAELPVAMHTNLEVAELVALLRRHGISPDEARANSSRSAVPTAAALSSSAAAGTNAANPPAPANEPEEAPSGRSSTQYECWLTMIFRRDWLRPLYQLSCPNRALRCPRRCCCRQRGSGCCSGCWCWRRQRGSCCRRRQPCSRCTCRLVKPLSLSTLVRCHPRSPSWRDLRKVVSIVAGPRRLPTLIYNSRDPTIKDLTNGVPDWTAVRFSTEAQARRRYAEEESAGRVMTFVDPPPTD